MEMKSKNEQNVTRVKQILNDITEVCEFFSSNFIDIADSE